MPNQNTLENIFEISDTLKEKGFIQRISGIEFVKGKQVVIVTPMGFVWKQGRQVITDLSFSELLQKI